MVLRQIYALYFSPTGGTEKIVSSIADTLSRSLELPVHLVDFTYLENRQKEYHFPNDLHQKVRPHKLYQDVQNH